MWSSKKKKGKKKHTSSQTERFVDRLPRRQSKGADAGRILAAALVSGFAARDDLSALVSDRGRISCATLHTLCRTAIYAWLWLVCKKKKKHTYINASRYTREPSSLRSYVRRDRKSHGDPGKPTTTTSAPEFGLSYVLGNSCRSEVLNAALPYFLNKNISI